MDRTAADLERLGAEVTAQHDEDFGPAVQRAEDAHGWWLSSPGAVAAGIAALV